MPSQLRNREQGPERLRQAKQPEIAVASSRADPERRPRLPDYRLVRERVLAVVTTTARVEPEEVLIADARANLTPTQMVERKLLALLRDVGPGVSLQQTDGPADFRGGGNPLSSRQLGPAKRAGQVRRPLASGPRGSSL
jgi:hypothetical protein